MAANLPQIELTRKDVVLVVGAKLIRLIAMQPTGSRWPLMHEHRHELGRCPLVIGLIDRIVIFAIDAAVDRMNQTVAKSRCWPNQERRRKNPLAAGHENGVDRVVHAAGHYR